MKNKITKFINYFKKNQPIKLVIMILVSFLFTYYLIGNNFKAKWGLIDDHAIINLLGPNLKLTINQLPNLIYNGVIGTYGTFIRQVPTYIVLRILEAFFWGNNPFLWYLFRFVTFGLSLFIFWIITRRYLGFVYSFIFMAYIMTGKYWSGILTRLGTHEIYAIPGVALYFLGFFNLINRKGRNSLNWLLIFLGTVIAVGSKENFIILFLPTTIIFLSELQKKRINISSFLYYFLSFCFTFLVTVGVILVLKKTGHDVYANNVGLTYRLKLFFLGAIQFIKIVKYKYFIIILFIINFVLLRFYNKKKAVLYLQLSVKYLLISIFFIFLYASQYAFYNGNWPTRMRYDFPGLMAMPFYWLLLFLYAVEIARFIKIKKIFIKIFCLLFFLFLSILTNKNGYSYLINSAEFNAEETVKFTNKINRLVSLSKEHRNIPIIFDSYSVFDYESIASVDSYLNAFGIKNSKYLRIHKYKFDINPEIAKILAGELYKISANGGLPDRWNFKPIKFLKEERDCVSVGFLRMPENECKYKETIP